MIYKIISTDAQGFNVFGKIDDDGICRLTCTEDYPEFKKWIEEGNTPEPADKFQQE